MSYRYSPPAVIPFDRFQPVDGLLIRAEHWQKSHSYHRQRQNLHYQSLHQPGIVNGLGVQPMTAPNNIAVEFRDGRWLQVDPGLAIDLYGNPIVVPEPISYRLAAPLPAAGTVTVYLVLRYVDPDSLHRQQPREFVRETFRIDEKTTPPGEQELELCRIELDGSFQSLQVPEEPLFPRAHQIDVRHRLSPILRSQAVVRVAQGITSDQASTHHQGRLRSLLSAAPALYPQLQGMPVDTLALDGTAEALPLERYDLIYLTGEQPLSLPATVAQQLRTYLASGGVLLIETPAKGVELARSVVALAKHWQLDLRPFEQLRGDHPVRRTPFVFALPPQTPHAARVFVGGGLVLGSYLSTGWDLTTQPPLDRGAIRTAQEFGINLLHYAWHRRHLSALLGSPASVALPAAVPSAPEPTPLPNPAADAAAPITPPVPTAPASRRPKSRGLLDQIIDSSEDASHG